MTAESRKFDVFWEMFKRRNERVRQLAAHQRLGQVECRATTHDFAALNAVSNVHLFVCLTCGAAI